MTMKLFEKFQTLMTAAAFAEENDHRTAREIAAETLAPAQKVREIRTTITGTLAVNHGE
jgi:hypothetical protein